MQQYYAGYIAFRVRENAASLKLRAGYIEQIAADHLPRSRERGLIEA